MSEPYVTVAPRGPVLPIVVSCPHSGVEVPPDAARGMHPEMVRDVPDTDWYVHELYDFAPAMGITLLHARFSRFVIDLNRDPDNRPLYADGRHQTGLVPKRAFDTRPIYLSKAEEPDDGEIKRRLERYYYPYHAKAEQLIHGLQAKFKHVLFYEAHSIKRLVSSIRPTPFPDLMLGDQKGLTAAPTVSQAALAGLRAGNKYQVAHNEPFMGGYLTRKFGKPAEGVHALQLEMSQDVYMNERLSKRDIGKQATTALHLAETLAVLAKALEALP